MSKPHPNAKEAYDAGVKAKRQGFGRVTPYYNQPRSDYWWFAGYDGMDFFEADKVQPEFTITRDFCGYHTPVVQAETVGKE